VPAECQHASKLPADEMDAMTKYLKLTTRFYPGQDDDLIAWLEDMHASYGKKGETVKDVLRKGLGAGSSNSAIQLDTGSLLADIRQVVESALASHALQPTVQTEAESQDDALAEEQLSRLDHDLTIDSGSSLQGLPDKW
jgi:hypothetical protein